MNYPVTADELRVAFERRLSEYYINSRVVNIDVSLNKEKSYFIIEIAVDISFYDSSSGRTAVKSLIRYINKLLKADVLIEKPLLVKRK
jgi:ABC-type oligopeptide transport system ATPase subunit